MPENNINSSLNINSNIDVIIIGAGIAGMSCALRLPNNLSIMILAKGSHKDSSSYYAQGGIACVRSTSTGEILEPGDSYDLHIKDTLIAGAGICDINIVRFVIENANNAINWLESQGVKFTKINSKPHLTQEGGHSKRRILHADDATGLEISRALLDKIKTKKNISINYNCFVTDLVVNNKICYGVKFIDQNKKNFRIMSAKKVVLASGGCSRVYKYSSNPYTSTGDGIAMAIRCGAKVSHMEFNQFHPTCLYHPDAFGFLLSEALRGEGAKLRLANGDRFMDKYHNLAELASRDIVARAIDSEIKNNNLQCVYLDISHREDNFIKKHFPNIYKKCLKFGFDLTKSPIPIIPAAHYSCGGICVDQNAQTSINNLYAIGEVSYTGLHGANRLASNSLLECVVYAFAAANNINNNIKNNMPNINFKSNFKSNLFDEIIDINLDKNKNKKIKLEQVLKSNINIIKQIMWERVGIIRSYDILLSAEKDLNNIYIKIKNINNKNNFKSDIQAGVSYFECLNLVQTCLWIIKSSCMRKESCGLHFVCESS